MFVFVDCQPNNHHSVPMGTKPATVIMLTGHGLFKGNEFFYKSFITIIQFSICFSLTSTVLL